MPAATFRPRLGEYVGSTRLPVSVCPTYRRSAAAASANHELSANDERARGTPPRVRTAAAQVTKTRPAAATACWTATDATSSGRLSGDDLIGWHRHRSRGPPRLARAATPSASLLGSRSPATRHPTGGPLTITTTRQARAARYLNRPRILPGRDHPSGLEDATRRASGNATRQLVAAHRMDRMSKSPPPSSAAPVQL
jgi:hypothetical protein